MRFLISAIIVLGTTIGSAWMASRGKKINLQDWAVGGRQFGGVLYWFLSAGDIFTTFAFLGASGWAYAYGAPGFYIFGNVALGYTLGYWLLPRLWEIGKKHRLLTQADFFNKRFGTPWLGSVLAVVGIVALIPYIELQFTGLGLILKLTFGSAVSTDWMIVFAGVIVLVFIFLTGLKSVALGSIVKDVFMVAILAYMAVMVGVFTHDGSLIAIFHHMDQTHPSYSRLPGLVPAKHYTSLWFMSALIVTNLGYWVWPQTFQYTFSARSGDVVRRNAVFQPLYALAYFFTFAIGFAALLAVPGLSSSNDALLALAAKYFPGWFLGLLAGGGMLVAIVPGSLLMLTAAALFADNIYRGLLKPRADDQEVLKVSRYALIGVAAVSVGVALSNDKTLVSILLIAYSMVSQLAPSVLLSLLWRRITKWGVLSGVVVGLLGVTVPTLIHIETLIGKSIDTALIAVAANFVVTVVVSLFTQPPSEEAIRVGIEPASGEMYAAPVVAAAPQPELHQ